MLQISDVGGITVYYDNVCVCVRVCLLLLLLSGLARFKPSGFNRGLNHGLNQVVFFLKKPIGFFFGFFFPS